MFFQTSSAFAPAFALGIAGGVCLLLWGSYMVRRGVERAYASRLGALVSGATGSRARGFSAASFPRRCCKARPAAILLASSMITAGLLPPLAAALAVILGADVGSAIAVRILYLDLSFCRRFCFAPDSACRA